LQLLIHNKEAYEESVMVDSLIYTDEYLRVRAVPTRHTSTYIFCHGKGQTGQQWQSLVEPLRKLGHCDHVAFIFPYLEFTNVKNEIDMLCAASLIQRIVAEEIVKGIPADCIAVGGIEEGFEVGLLATVGDCTKIAGTVGISDGLEYTHAIVSHKKAANAETPIFLIVDAAETSNGTLDGTLEKIGQPVGALVYEKNISNIDSKSVPSKVFHWEKTFEMISPD
jgi:hypothetical protein